MNKVILDASALLALINRETGSDVVAEAMPHAIISAVNLAEVASVLVRIGIPTHEIEVLLKSLVSVVENFNEEQAYATAKLKTQENTDGLSLGDRACLALGMLKNIPVLTADKAWDKLKNSGKIKVIR
jgi:PIN domain nuclease of toxin-antitoxin system